MSPRCASAYAALVTVFLLNTSNLKVEVTLTFSQRGASVFVWKSATLSPL